MRPLRMLVLLLAVASPVWAQPRDTARASAPSATTFAIPAWAFPTQRPAPPDAFLTADSVHPHRIPGLTRTFTAKQALDRFAPVDWDPGTHPPAPPSVARGRRPAAFACAFCHLYSGAGRPENATLAGLSAEYIVQQVRAFRDSTRLAANPVTPVNSMHAMAKAFTDAEVAEAAAYFAGLTLTRRNRVVEGPTVPRHRVMNIFYVRDGTGAEPIAGRLIEMPEDAERHELHDPTVPYVTYVPPGSLALGRRVVRGGPAGVATACATCHGPDLLGVGNIPPIAGRSPQYLLRQLLNIRSGARADSASAAMQAVVGAMSLQQMVAAAAYVGSLPPSARRPRAR